MPPSRFRLPASDWHTPQDAMTRLVDLVGPAAAKLLLFSARVFGAEEASSMGLVQERVPKAALDGHVTSLATQISRLAPLTHRATKLSVDAIADKTRSGAASDARRVCYDSADFREGVQAFLDKRPAAFEGS